MSGVVETIFVVVAAVLRALAWVPFGAAWGLNACADWCELRAARERA